VFNQSFSCKTNCTIVEQTATKLHKSPDGKDYRIGTVRYNWPMSVHASQAFSTSTVPIRKICLQMKQRGPGVGSLLQMRDSDSGPKPGLRGTLTLTPHPWMP